MGEVRKDALKLDFERRLKLEFHGRKFTSDARMTGCAWKLRSSDEKCGVTVRGKSVEMLAFHRIGVFLDLSGKDVGQFNGRKG